MAPEQWKTDLLDLRQLYLVKHRRVLQTLFYLLGYEREQVCERDTNSLDFKKAKELLDDHFLMRMQQYNPCGERPSDQFTFHSYQKLSFLKQNIADIEDDKVEEFSVVMLKLLKWMQLAIEIRIDDVVRRRDAVEIYRYDRANFLKQDEARKEKYEKELAEKKSAFEEAVDAELQKQADARRAQVEDDEEQEQQEVPEAERP